jgi:hypothetical protein
MAFILNFFRPFTRYCIADIDLFLFHFQLLREKFIGDFSEYHLSFFNLKNPLQAHSAISKNNKNLNALLRKELED